MFATSSLIQAAHIAPSGTRRFLFAILRGALAVAAMLAGGGARAEVRLGDDYGRVIAEKGKPSATLEARGVQILQYPGERIKLGRH